jgi:hypothetical protein
MNFTTHSFRHAEVILNEPRFIAQYQELLAVIRGITDGDLIARHTSFGANDIEKTPKSISKAINELLKERLIALGWQSESGIFQDPNYLGDTWRLDFAKEDISIEVAFNHSTVIAWNLTKPVLASELNHVRKAIQTQIGVVITATEDLKEKGGFDGAVGTYEKFLDYLPPMRNVLTVPLLIIGLQAPASFVIDEHQHAPRKKIGRIRMI